MVDAVVQPEGRVWIHCPAQRVTGGPEALHQLARALLDSGVDARMVYYAAMGGPAAVPGPYQVYAPRIATHSEDKPADVVVVPEVRTEGLRRIRRARKVVWWLSIDNYLAARSRSRLRGFASWLAGAAALPISRLRGCVHCAQSVYAVEYLQRQGIPAVLLTDYLRSVHTGHADVRNDAERGRTILYNPLKGYEFTRGLMEAVRGDCRWVALEGMSPEEVAAAMRGARLYVDFGHHPGRDRMPREAAAHGCCVLTGRRGSAGLHADLPIPDWYKIDETKPDAVAMAAARIEEILAHYPLHYARFAGYRAWIARQQTEFLAQVHSVFLPAAGGR